MKRCLQSGHSVYSASHLNSRFCLDIEQLLHEDLRCSSQGHEAGSVSQPAASSFDLDS